MFPKQRRALAGIAWISFAIASVGAWAQASPYAGAWNGLLVDNFAETCTCTSPSCAGSVIIDNAVCTTTTPWTATVDPSGNFSLSFGSGLFHCNTGQADQMLPGSDAPFLIGQIPSNGSLPRPASTSSGTNADGSSYTDACTASVYQFLLAPPSVTRSYTCDATIINVVNGSASNPYYSTCRNHTQHTYAGAPTVVTPPVFPVKVTSNITATTANATATIQPRPQDVGTTQDVFVFMHAPSNLVKGAGGPVAKTFAGAPYPAREEDAIVCVLAQVVNGQLVTVTPATMQAYLSGVLSSQGQAITLLNNVATQNVAGASVFVGYGKDAASMFANGLYESALSVAGPVQCTSQLDNAPAPKLPGALSGLWWNANESGWGIHFTQRGANIFAAWYTYDKFGGPTWYVASNCSGVTGTSGTCTGPLYSVTGPSSFGIIPTPTTAVNVVTAGSLRVSFQDANTASITYTLAGQTRTVAITRQPVGTGTVAPVVDYTDLWFNPNEPGWGMAMAQHSGNIFLAWYVYNSQGLPTWYVVSNCVVSGSSCAGTLYATSGAPFGSSFDPTQVQATAVGSVILSFIDANNAVFSYKDGAGNSRTKVMTRQLF
jgi:hypothetical protein